MDTLPFHRRSVHAYIWLPTKHAFILYLQYQRGSWRFLNLRASNDAISRSVPSQLARYFLGDGG